MAKEKIVIVWFKRDLRVHDHEPLSMAVKTGSLVLPVYVVEPEYWQLPDTALRHWQFIEGALEDLTSALSQLGAHLHIVTSSVVEFFQDLMNDYDVAGVFSHQETGNNWTFQRDLQVKQFLAQHKIPWHEFPQFGVIRGSFNRNHWGKYWHNFMEASQHDAPEFISSIAIESPQWTAPLTQSDELVHCLQQPNRLAGLHCLKTFLRKRGVRYAGQISSPSTAWDACSRLSPYITYGLLSLREIYQQTLGQIESYEASPNNNFWWVRSLTNFLSRLHWHCHFIQKLEIDPTIEYENMLPLADDLRPKDPLSYHLQAWLMGQTGYPFVDACMTMLRQTGWINFRMRAMLVSFASYQLWLDWQDFGPCLARLFVDYEPGIHYAQLQMQSGTTGINAMRVYNPIKQSKEHDPEGQFIRRWLPVLKTVPNDYIHEPWLMSDDQQKEFHCVLGKDYPMPIIDNKSATKKAKDKVYAIRSHPDYAQYSRQIFLKHGSRKKQR